MILEKIISFDTAKLAKEKGVPQTIYQESYWVDSDGNEINAQNVNGRIQEFKDAGYVTAYTQSALQKWLRDEHELHIEVQIATHQSEEAFHWHIFGRYYNLDVFMCIDDSNGTKYTYEQALEQALQSALNLIEEESNG